MYSNSLLRNKDIHSQTIENGLKHYLIKIKIDMASISITIVVSITIHFLHLNWVQKWNSNNILKSGLFSFVLIFPTLVYTLKHNSWSNTYLLYKDQTQLYKGILVYIQQDVHLTYMYL